MLRHDEHGWSETAEGTIPSWFTQTMHAPTAKHEAREAHEVLEEMQIRVTLRAVGGADSSVVRKTPIRGWMPGPTASYFVSVVSFECLVHLPSARLAATRGRPPATRRGRKSIKR
jgi:hypothetical protein